MAFCCFSVVHEGIVFDGGGCVSQSHTVSTVREEGTPAVHARTHAREGVTVGRALCHERQSGCVGVWVWVCKMSLCRSPEWSPVSQDVVWYWVFDSCNRLVELKSNNRR